MMDIKWDDKYLVGHPRIDHEHQVFVDLIRAVSIAADAHMTKERAARLLMEVKKYAEFHFVSEENIMIDADFPELDTHQREHNHLLARLDDEVHRFRHDQIDLNHITNFMFEWFALHTTKMDLRLTRYLAEKNQATPPLAAPV